MTEEQVYMITIAVAGLIIPALIGITFGIIGAFSRRTWENRRRRRRRKR